MAETQSPGERAGELDTELAAALAGARVAMNALFTAARNAKEHLDEQVVADEEIDRRLIKLESTEAEVTAFLDIVEQNAQALEDDSDAPITEL